MYTKMKLFCQACGREMNITINFSWHRRACCYACFKEIEWREILSNLGKEYYPHPEAESWQTSYLQRPYQD